jgi:transposase-like protein
MIDGDGEIDIDVARDRNGDFEPTLVRKRRVRKPALEKKFPSVCTLGMTTRGETP